MAKKELQIKRNKDIEYRKYTDTELQDFHNKVQKYYFDYTLQNGKDVGEVIRVLDRERLMVAFGARTSSGAIVVDEVSLPPNRLQQFDNCFRQWQDWKVRTGLDKGSWGHKNLQSLDEMAKQMTVPRIPDTIPFDADYQIPF